jgi:hypothetical protein
MGRTKEMLEEMDEFQFERKQIEIESEMYEWMENIKRQVIDVCDNYISNHVKDDGYGDF